MDSKIIFQVLVINFTLFLIVYFYFLIKNNIKTKRLQKEHDKQKKKLEVNSKVVFSGGLIGVVQEIDIGTKTVKIEIDTGISIVVEAWAIQKII